MLTWRVHDVSRQAEGPITNMIRGGSSNVVVSGGENSIVVELESSEPFHRLKGVFSYEQLPIEFRVLFQDIQDFHSFLLDNSSQCLRVEDRKLYVQVNVAGRVREYVLPLQVLELTPQQQLKERIWILQEMVENKEKKIEKDRVFIQNLKRKVDSQEGKMHQLEKKGREKDATILELRSEIASMKELLQGQTSETLKLKGYCRQLQNREDEQFQPEEEEKQREEAPPQSSKKKASSSQSRRKPKPVKQQTDQPMEAEPTINSKTDKPKGEKEERPKVERQQQNFGTSFTLWPCKQCKYLSKFEVASNGIVEKLHGPTYQLYNGQALPLEGRFYFDVRIILIKNNNIVVGVITEKCKEEQFSFKKMNCICYNGYDGSICEEDRQKYVSFKPKEGNRIRTVVDLGTARVDWHIMEGNHSKVHIGSAAIPASMLKQPLYPYFQLYWEGNKVRLN